MRQSLFVRWVVLALACLASRGYAQGLFTPLYLFTSGDGIITPLQSGQLVEVGQNYEITAVPNPGSVFGSWQPVNVFTLTTFVIDPNGDPRPVVSVTRTLVPTYTSEPVLQFTAQPAAVLMDIPGVSTLTESSGWQANFAAVPEPSGTALFVSGALAIGLLRGTKERPRREKGVFRQGTIDRFHSRISWCPSRTKQKVLRP